MAATDANAGMGSTRPHVPRIVSSIVLGLVVGILASYLIAVAATAPLPGDFTIDPLTLLMIGLVGAVAVADGWRGRLPGRTG